MRAFVYDFSLLEPVASDKDFAEKANPPMYATLSSLFSPKKLVALYFIDRCAKKGMFYTPGRYRLTVTREGKNYRAKIRRFV